MMAKKINQLTAREVATLRRPGRHPDGDGLYLSIGKGGAKSWVFLFWKDGRRHELGLGSARKVSLAAARVVAKAKRTLRDAGQNPLSGRLGGMLFSEVAEEYIEEQAPHWRNAKHKWQWGQTLGPKFCKLILNKPCASITDDDVHSVPRPISTSKPETTSR